MTLFLIAWALLGYVAATIYIGDKEPEYFSVEQKVFVVVFGGPLLWVLFVFLIFKMLFDEL